MSSAKHEICFDVAVLNNMGNRIKTRVSWISVDSDEQVTDDILRDKLAQEMGFRGIGNYFVFEHNADVRIGDEMPSGEPLHTVNISVTANSSVYENVTVDDSVWIPVAAVGQKSGIMLADKYYECELGEAGFLSSEGTWAGCSINVNHNDNEDLYGFTVLDSKYINGILYHKLDKKIADVINSAESTGCSIQIDPLRFDGDTVTEFKGNALSILFPPFKPACSAEIGCPSAKKPVIQRVLDSITSKTKLVLNSNSYNSPAELPQNLNNPVQEKIMTSEADVVDVESENLKAELETMKTTVADMETQLAAYKEAELKAAEQKKEEQWSAIKSNLPKGMIHKPEDAEALRNEFMNDPASFAVTFASARLERETVVAGSEFNLAEKEEPAGIQAMKNMNIKLGEGLKMADYTNDIAGTFGTHGPIISCILDEGAVTVVSGKDSRGYEIDVNVFASPLSRGNLVAISNDVACTWSATGGSPVVERAVTGESLVIGVIDTEPQLCEFANTSASADTLAERLAAKFYNVANVRILGGITAIMKAEVTLDGTNGVIVGQCATLKQNITSDYADNETTEIKLITAADGGTGLVAFHYVADGEAGDTVNCLVGINGIITSVTGA